MTTPNTTPPNESPEKKGRGCKTKCCGTGSCEMKLRPLCFIIKITLLIGLTAFAVQYFTK